MSFNTLASAFQQAGAVAEAVVEPPTLWEDLDIKDKWNGGWLKRKVTGDGQRVAEYCEAWKLRWPWAYNTSVQFHHHDGGQCTAVLRRSDSCD